MEKSEEFSKKIKNKSYVECLGLRNEIFRRVSAFEAGQGDFYQDRSKPQEYMFYDDLIRLSILCGYMAEKYKDNDYNVWSRFE